jgi:hypothetical protein
MIAMELVEEITRLLAEGRLSQRSIARLTGVSRGTIGAIASGKRPAPREKPEEEEMPTGPPQRCPGCGGYVYLPCRLCRVRDALRKESPTRIPDRPFEPIRLELTEEQHARYERLHAMRCMTPEVCEHPEETSQGVRL